MKTIMIDIDSIRAAIGTTNAAYEAEFSTITSDDTQCRIWIYRFERMITRLQAGAAAVRMADDEATDAAIESGVEEWDGMGDINGDLLTAMVFDSTAKQYAANIRYLERQDRELRGVARDD